MSLSSEQIDFISKQFANKQAEFEVKFIATNKTQIPGKIKINDVQIELIFNEKEIQPIKLFFDKKRKIPLFLSQDDPLLSRIDLSEKESLLFNSKTKNERILIFKIFQMMEHYQQITTISDNFDFSGEILNYNSFKSMIYCVILFSEINAIALYCFQQGYINFSVLVSFSENSNPILGTISIDRRNILIAYQNYSNQFSLHSIRNITLKERENVFLDLHEIKLTMHSNPAVSLLFKNCVELFIKSRIIHSRELQYQEPTLEKEITIVQKIEEIEKIEKKMVNILQEDIFEIPYGNPFIFKISLIDKKTKLIFEENGTLVLFINGLTIFTPDEVRVHRFDMQTNLYSLSPLGCLLTINCIKYYIQFTSEKNSTSGTTKQDSFGTTLIFNNQGVRIVYPEVNKFFNYNNDMNISFHPKSHLVVRFSFNKSYQLVIWFESKQQRLLFIRTIMPLLKQGKEETEKQTEKISESFYPKIEVPQIPSNFQGQLIENEESEECEMKFEENELKIIRKSETKKIPISNHLKLETQKENPNIIRIAFEEDFIIISLRNEEERKLFMRKMKIIISNQIPNEIKKDTNEFQIKFLSDNFRNIGDGTLAFRNSKLIININLMAEIVLELNEFSFAFHKFDRSILFIETKEKKISAKFENENQLINFIQKYNLAKKQN
ncbi:hypothetical protein M0811_12459 [Anaeramoeba ignava]|uniref:Uncharacterized protein n=1 Tax=Anaeramoeba ignava TaxID=1746090 RepID=A0A9Q0R5N5_ANAIG|nr:hypothetical protein M0811_12459 [Anaeramoeba ignava]